MKSFDLPLTQEEVANWRMAFLKFSRKQNQIFVFVRIRFRIRVSKILKRDPDPNYLNSDPQHWAKSVNDHSNRLVSIRTGFSTLLALYLFL